MNISRIRKPLLAASLVVAGVTAAFATSAPLPFWAQNDADHEYYAVEDNARGVQATVVQPAGSEKLVVTVAPFTNDANPVTDKFTVTAANLVIDEDGFVQRFPMSATGAGFESTIDASLVFGPGKRTVRVEADGFDASGAPGAWTDGMAVSF